MPKKPLYDFAREWIENNVSDLMYANMPDHVMQLVNTLLAQRHSGSSIRIVLRLLNQLMEDYLEDNHV